MVKFKFVLSSRLRYSRGYRDVSNWVEDVEREEEWEDQSEKERERFDTA